MLPLEIVFECVAVAVGGNQTKVGVFVAESWVGVRVVNPLPVRLVGLQAEIGTIKSRKYTRWAAFRKKNPDLEG